MHSLKQQCLISVKYYSEFSMLKVSQLPASLMHQLNQLELCCFSNNIQCASALKHDLCYQKAKLNQLACCSGDYFSTAVWNDHFLCAERISKKHNLVAYLKNVIEKRDDAIQPPIFIETRAAVKYLMEIYAKFLRHALVWIAKENDFESFDLLLRWGCLPTKEVFNAVLADTMKISAHYSIQFNQVCSNDYCTRLGDNFLAPPLALKQQSMRKSNVKCLMALLQYELPTKRHVKRAIVNDNLQCLAFLVKQGCLLPDGAINIAVVWDSLDCLNFLLGFIKADNSVIGLAIENRSFRCAKLLFNLGYSKDLAVYYCVKYRCFQLLKYFTKNGGCVGGLEFLVDDCAFLKTAFAVNCLYLPGTNHQKVENFFNSKLYEQYIINQQLAFCGNGENIDLFSLLS